MHVKEPRVERENREIGYVPPAEFEAAYYQQTEPKAVT
jgi:hypothetical protein